MTNLANPSLPSALAIEAAPRKSSYIKNECGYLRIFSLEPTISIGFSSVKIENEKSFFSLLPTKIELSETQKIILDFSELASGYPSFIAPLCTWIHSHGAQLAGIKIVPIPPKDKPVSAWLKSIGLYEVLQGSAPAQPPFGPSLPLTPIFPGDNEAPGKISTTIMELLDRTGLRLTTDAHHSTYSALSEILENVVRHSNSHTPAFVCAQAHPTQRKFSVCISDAGIGIAQSFLTGPYPIPAERMRQGDDPLELAIEPFISSKYGMGHSGWGLFYASELCRDAHGTFTITSGSQSLYIYNGNQYSTKHAYWEGTIVNILLSTDSKIDGAHVWSKLPPFDEIDFLANFSNQTIKSDYTYSLKRISSRLFTRISARSALEQFWSESSRAEQICISTEGILVATPSFVDEFFCGILRKLGLARFQKTITISETTPYLKMIIEMVLQNEVRREKGLTSTDQ